MMPRHLRALLLAGFAVGISGAADAATLTPHGVVLINRGSGYVRVNGPIEVSTGQIVMVTQGSASMSCGTAGGGSISAGQIRALASNPCEGLDGFQGEQSNFNPTSTGLPPSGVIIGAGAIAAGVTAAVVASSKRSASP